MEQIPSHVVVIALFAGVDALDVAGPAEVFTMANVLLAPGRPNYELRLAGVRPGRVPTFSGVPLHADIALDELRERNRPGETRGHVRRLAAAHLAAVAIPPRVCSISRSIFTGGVPMCQRTVCRGCGKPTYVGCGNHVEQVLGDVPVAKRCSCEPPRGGLLRRLSALFGSR